MATYKIILSQISKWGSHKLTESECGLIQTFCLYLFVKRIVSIPTFASAICNVRRKYLYKIFVTMLNLKLIVTRIQNWCADKFRQFERRFVQLFLIYLIMRIIVCLTIFGLKIIQMIGKDIHMVLTVSKYICSHIP
jgi:hypothetical protein